MKGRKKSGQSSHYKITILRDGLGRSAELRQNALPHRIDASFQLFCLFTHCNKLTYIQFLSNIKMGMLQRSSLKLARVAHQRSVLEIA